MHPQRTFPRAAALLAPLALVGAAFLFPTTAGAASGGAGAPDVPAINGGGSPGGASVLCTVTAPPAGGTETCSGVTVTVGPTTDGLSIAFSTSAGPSCAAAPALSVSFVDPTTNQAAGPLSATVTYANGSITAGETILVFDSASGGWVLPPSGAVSSGSTSAGKAQASLTGSGALAVETANCSSAISGATVPVTGKPFLGEELLAGGLIFGGLLALGIVLLRRPARRAV